MSSVSPSMEKHVQLLGVFYIGFGILGVLAALIVFVAITGGGLISGDHTAMAITATVGTLIAGLLLLLSLPAILGGVGLIRKAVWARPLVLILGVLNLINIPFGTVLGIYTLWVLMHDQAAPLFNPSPVV